MQTTVMLSALLFDPFARVNKTPNKSLAVCTSVFFFYFYNKLSVKQWDLMANWIWGLR